MLSISVLPFDPLVAFVARGERSDRCSNIRSPPLESPFSGSPKLVWLCAVPCAICVAPVPVRCLRPLRNFSTSSLILFRIVAVDTRRLRLSLVHYHCRGCDRQRALVECSRKLSCRTSDSSVPSFTCLMSFPNKFGMFQPGQSQTDYPRALAIQKAQIGTFQ